MKATKTLKVLLVVLVSTLISGSALAQLSLSADAEAEADATEGADAEANADASTEEGEAAEEEAEPAVAEPEGIIPIMDEPMDAETDPVGTAGYDNGFFIQTNDGKFKLKIRGMAKTRYTFLNDEWTVIGNNGDPGRNHTMHSYFSQDYARIHLSGNFIDKRLGYCLYYNFPTNTVVYGYATWTFIPEKLVLRVGKGKIPFSRSYLVSSVKRQFIDDPTGQFGHGLDIGIQIGNAFTKVKGIEWAVGIFNGGQGIGGDFSPSIVGRFGFNNGIKGYSETDFEGGPLRFAVALNASTEFDHDDDDITQHYLGVDGMLKIHGLSVTAAGYFNATAENAMFDNQDLNRIGTYVGAGFLIKDLLEPVARYGMEHSVLVDNDVMEEITAGLTLHIFKNHAFKWENNISLLTERAENAACENPALPVYAQCGRDTFRDVQFMSQLQFFF